MRHPKRACAGRATTCVRSGWNSYRPVTKVGQSVSIRQTGPMSPSTGHRSPAPYGAWAGAIAFAVALAAGLALALDSVVLLPTPVILVAACVVGLAALAVGMTTYRERRRRGHGRIRSAAGGCWDGIRAIFELA